MLSEEAAALALADSTVAREPAKLAIAVNPDAEGQPSTEEPAEGEGVVQMNPLSRPALPASADVHTRTGTTPATRIIPQTEATVVPSSGYNEKAIITRDDIVGSDGTVREALLLWNARKGPVIYNVFVSAFFALQRDFGHVDAEAHLGETQAEKRKRIVRWSGTHYAAPLRRGTHFLL